MQQSLFSLPDVAPHCAKYSEQLLPPMADVLSGAAEVYDPMAGTGKIFRLRQFPNFSGRIFASELQRKWAAHHPETFIANALDVPFADQMFQAVCFSPPYANRMADTFTDGTHRMTYAAYHGSPLHDENVGTMQWGAKYRRLMTGILIEAARVNKRRGLIVIICKDHIRSSTSRAYPKDPYARLVGTTQSGAPTYEIGVCQWYKDVLAQVGYELTHVEHVTCPGNRMGKNGEVRFDYEEVIVFRQTDDPLSAGWGALLGDALADLSDALADLIDFCEEPDDPDNTD